MNLQIFANSLTHALGMAPTPGRRAFFVEWERWENASAAFNPLCTTQPGGEDPADPYYNTFGENGEYHVRNYASFEAGVAATAATLMNGRYNAILRSLALERVQPAAAAEVSVWGTTGFASQLRGGWKPAEWTAFSGDSDEPPPAADDPADPGPVPEEPVAALTLVELWARLDEIHRLVRAVGTNLNNLNRAVIARDQLMAEAFDALAEASVLASARASQAATLELPPE